jgi:hypothetical protein
LSGAGAPQFPHFLLMYSLVNKNGGGIKTAVLLFPAGVIRQVIFFQFLFSRRRLRLFSLGFSRHGHHYYKPTGSLSTIRAQKTGLLFHHPGKSSHGRKQGILKPAGP